VTSPSSASENKAEGAALVAPSAVPEALRERPQWVLWKLEQRPDKPKPDKVPYSVRGGRASSTDPKTWAPFEDARLAFENGSGYDGVGFVVAETDDIVGLDFDDCRVGTDLLHPEVGALLLLLDSYAEWSPSGNGVRAFVRGKLNGSPNKTGETPWKGQFETYERARFLTVTGRHLRGTPLTVEPRQAALETTLARMFPQPTQNLPPSNTASNTLAADVEDEVVLERAFAARNGATIERLFAGDVNGYATQSEAELALCSLLAFWTGPDPARLDRFFRASRLMRPKWEREDYRTRTLSLAIQGCSEFYDWTKDSELPVLEPSRPEAKLPRERLRVITFDQIRARPVEWLVPGFVPKRRTTNLYGEEGVGQGLWWVLTAAELSQQGLRTLVYVSEDRPDEDIVARFVAAGGDRSCLAVVEIESLEPNELPRSLDLARDASFFEEALENVRPALVVVDPLIGQIDKAFDADKAQHVRAFLRPLDAAVARYDASLLGVIHLNRSPSTNPMHRVSASKAFREIARSTLILGRDPGDQESDWRVLALDKKNLTGDVQSRAYRVERLEVEVDGHTLPTARLAFLGYTDQTARDLLTPRVDDRDAELDRAKQFLRDLLEHAPLAANVGLELAEREKIARRTLERARAELGVVWTMGRNATWELPA